MKIIALKIALIILLLAISYQDLKERKISLWLLIVSGLLIGYLHFNVTSYSQFIINICINCIVVFLIVFVLSIYVKLKIKKTLRESLGGGDILFFFVMAVGFSNLTFLLLFVFSIFFSSAIYLVFQHRIQKNLIPLAGLQSLFIALVFLVNWSFQLTNLYSY